MQKNAPNPFKKIFKPLQEFIRLESAGGLVLMVTAALGLVIANTPLEIYYKQLLDLPLEVRIGSFNIAKPLLLWINDGLMATFFFLVGMELKREVIEGHLSSLRRASLPGFAALGGILVPAALYAAFNWDDSIAMRGWAIPAATDIAFALGVLALLGKRVPTALKAFLLSVAIFDDLAAIVVIALFYTAGLSIDSLIVAAILIFILASLNRLNVTKPSAYVVVGILLWVALLKSGLHATLAGAIVAMAIPLRTPGNSQRTPVKESLLRRLERGLHPWVAFLVLPLFAFANAGVSITRLSISDALNPVPLGIVAGLLFGKQIGIMAFSWVATRLRIAVLPEGVGWWQLYGTSLLCGIGFTMSLFIASLAFEQGSDIAQMGLERLGILIGTLVSGVCGYILLRAQFPRHT
jgi:Na+:H+ antiporter, NhaA family